MSKTVIEMAKEAVTDAPFDAMQSEFLERFAELIRDDERAIWMERTVILIRGEREACAQLCEDQWQTAHDIQDAIRARSKT